MVNRSARSSWLWSCCFLGAVATGCGLLRPAEPPPPPVEPPPPPPPIPAPPPPMPRDEGPYPLEDAVADALSGELQHLGTGPWHGNHRVNACAYRNERVIVVNVYCTLKEPRAFRVEVYSPDRGRARIYAEAKVPVSTVSRRDYFTFNAESEPPPARGARLAPVSLGMSFADLRAYEERRYSLFPPTCHGGYEHGRRQGGCLGSLGPQAGVWAARNQAFLDQPPESYYRLMRELRAQAARHATQQE